MHSCYAIVGWWPCLAVARKCVDLYIRHLHGLLSAPAGEFWEKFKINTTTAFWLHMHNIYILKIEKYVYTILNGVKAYSKVPKIRRIDYDDIPDELGLNIQGQWSAMDHRCWYTHTSSNNKRRAVGSLLTGREVHLSQDPLQLDPQVGMFESSGWYKKNILTAMK